MKNSYVHRLWIFLLMTIILEHTAITGNCFGCCAVVANGTLTLTSPLNIKNTADKSVKISSGRYEASMKMIDKDQVIAIHIIRAAGSNQVIEMRLPEGVIARGEFMLKGAQIGQEFDVVGHITDNTTRTPTLVRNDTCTWTETVWLPRMTQIVRYGMQRVVYHNLQTTYNNRLQFLVNQAPVGMLEANRYTNYEVVEDMGPCY